MKRLSQLFVSAVVMSTRAALGQPEHIRISVEEAKRILQILREQGTRIPDGACVKAGRHAASIRLGLDDTYPGHSIDFIAHTYKGKIISHLIEPHSPPGGRDWTCKRYMGTPDRGPEHLAHCFQQLTF